MTKSFAMSMLLLVSVWCVLAVGAAAGEPATRPTTEPSLDMNIGDVIVTDEQGNPIKYAGVEPVSANINGEPEYTDKTGHATIPVVLAYIDRVQWITITKDGFDDQHLNAPNRWPLKVVLTPETRPTTLPARDKESIRPTELEPPASPRVATTADEFCDLCMVGTPQDVSASVQAGANVNAKNRDGQTPLIAAVPSFSNLEAMAVLLKAGADINAKDNSGRTALELAVERYEKNAVELLLANKADVNAKDRDGNTPLHRAATEGQRKMAKLLLANKADINAKNNSAATPLHLAAERGKVDVVELLLANKADVNAKDNKGQTPLRLAVAKDHELASELLREYGGTK